MAPCSWIVGILWFESKNDRISAGLLIVVLGGIAKQRLPFLDMVIMINSHRD